MFTSLCHIKKSQNSSQKVWGYHHCQFVNEPISFSLLCTDLVGTKVTHFLEYKDLSFVHSWFKIILTVVSSNADIVWNLTIQFPFFRLWFDLISIHFNIDLIALSIQ